MTKDAKCDVVFLNTFIKSYVPNSVLCSNIGSEISYGLARSDVGLFAPLFLELEQSCIQLGILSFGVTVTTMEEVFLAVDTLHSAKSIQNVHLNVSVVSLMLKIII